MPTELRLQEIRQEITTCQLCQLAKERLNAVPGEGPANVDIMFIGEAPGFHENRQGKPFVGQAGQFLDELLQAAGVDRDQVYITNVVKCRPPNNRDPLPEELKACQHYLDEQIALLNPQVIVTLGRISMSKFITDGRISAIHGHTHNINGRKVVTMYHPAAALHQPALRQTLIKDFARLKKFIGAKSSPQPVQRDPEPVVLPPSPEGTSTVISQDHKIIDEKNITIESEEQKPPEQLSLF